MNQPILSKIEISETPCYTERRKKPLARCVASALDRYFNDLQGHEPKQLYEMVLCEIEAPLLESVLNYTRGNQSKAAEVLGINRTTLRKKLTKYGLNK